MKRFTYKDLRDKLNKLTDEQLDRQVFVAQIDEPGIRIMDCSEIGEDIYVNKDDSEDGGSMESLRMAHEIDNDGEPFDESKYELSTTKDCVFLYDEEWFDMLKEK